MSHGLPPYVNITVNEILNMEFGSEIDGKDPVLSREQVRITECGDFK